MPTAGGLVCMIRGKESTKARSAGGLECSTQTNLLKMIRIASLNLGLKSKLMIFSDL